MTCHALAAGNNSMASCDMIIYGMTLADMNSISTLGQIFGKQNKDKMDVYAGDSVSGMSHLYSGEIWTAYSDYQGGPNVPFHISAFAGAGAAAQIVKPTSVNQKSVDVGGLMGQLAGQAGLSFENNGVSVNIAYPYLPGSARKQIQLLANHANIHFAIDRGILAIWPNNGSRSATATVSPTTGLVGYPSWAQEGIRLKMIYSPNLSVGGQITVSGSQITPANGTWTITRLEHSLQCLTPNGEWFSNVQGSRQGGPSLAS